MINEIPVPQTKHFHSYSKWKLYLKIIPNYYYWLMQKLKPLEKTASFLQNV